MRSNGAMPLGGRILWDGLHLDFDLDQNILSFYEGLSGNLGDSLGFSPFYREFSRVKGCWGYLNRDRVIIKVCCPPAGIST